MQHSTLVESKNSGNCWLNTYILYLAIHQACFKSSMDLNTSDLQEPDMDEQASQLSLTPFTSPSSKSSLATSDLLEVDIDVKSCSEVLESSVTTYGEAELDSTVFDDDFGFPPIVYSSDECDAEGKNIQRS